MPAVEPFLKRLKRTWLGLMTENHIGDVVEHLEEIFWASSDIVAVQKVL